MSAQGTQDVSSPSGAIVAIGLGLAIIVVAVVLVLNIDPHEQAQADDAHRHADAKQPATHDPPAPVAAPREPADAQAMVELPLELPNEAFGTPKDIPPGTRMLPLTNNPRPPLMVPDGVSLLSLGKPVIGSDDNIFVGSLDLVTDGDKEPLDSRWVELAPGVQWVQVDLERSCEIIAIVIWHQHQVPKVYRDVIVQVSDDPQFKTGVITVFNNDYDNSAKFGAGEDYEYFDNYEGRLIDCMRTVDGNRTGVTGRYIRWYANGNTDDAGNQFTELEAWGRPIAD